MTQSEAKLLEGKPLAQAIQADLAKQVAALKAAGHPLKMVTVEVGIDQSSKVYVKRQGDACRKIDIEHTVMSLDPKIPQADLLAQIEALNRDPGVSGIILQLPLPQHLVSGAAQEHLDPSKDVEGVHPENLGRLLGGLPVCAPPTALAAFELIKAGVKAATGSSKLRGMEAVVVGRSQIVGRPLALMLLAESCTVTICHTGTRDLGVQTRRGEILVVAAGKARLIRGEMIKPGAIVVDVGTNSEEAGGKWSLVGDVEFASAKTVAGWLSPVPGGVGPLTVMMLLRNLVLSAEKKAGLGIGKS